MSIEDSKYATEIKSALVAESLKPYSTRNQEYATQDNPVVGEQFAEESKGQPTQIPVYKEESNFATIAENLPASATEIDPMPAIRPEDENQQTLQARPEGGKIEEEQTAKLDEQRENNKTSILPESEKVDK